MTTSALPRIVVIALGGTIAGSAASSTDTTGYRAGTTGIEQVLAQLPEVRQVADVSSEQFAQLDSSDMTDALALDLARRVNQLAASADVDGIVISHGTDTLEETAYFLHLVVKSAKPIVLVGAMRPASSLSPDGPMNLYSAVIAAASPASTGQGVLVVMNDEIHTARDVTKTSSLRVDAFESPYGPLGTIVGGRAIYYRAVSRPHTLATEFDTSTLKVLPSGLIIFAHTGLNSVLSESLVYANYDIIVHAGFGNGTVAHRIVGALEAASEAGSLIVRATRTGSGHVTLVGASDEAVNAWPSVDDQNPQRARILGCLALTVTSDPAEIQRIFHTY